MKSLLLISTFFFSTLVGFSQKNSIDYPLNSESNWLSFSKDDPKDPNRLIELYRDKIGLSEGQELLLKKTTRDALGISHFRYQQIHNGIAVEGGEIIFHSNGEDVWANGRIVRDLQNQSSTPIQESEALESALEFVDANQYFWEDEKQEALIKKIKKDQNASFFPKGELMYAEEKHSQNGANYELTWKFEIYSFGDKPLEYIYVNALTGEISHSYSGAHSETAYGIGVTRYHGEQDIITDSVDVDLFHLVDATRGGGIETYNLQSNDTLANGVHFEDDDNYWDNANAEKDEVATDIHWSMEMSYDYFLTQHGRDSYDDNGAPIIAYAHYGNNTMNAFWIGLYAAFGDGSAGDPLTYIDVVAHELSHGVSKTSAGLFYSYETGALNESFSDIFGQAVEFWAFPDSANWTVGKHSFEFRSMSDPNQFQDPDTYLGTYWITGSQDFGGVHTNSGVQNYWYYLLCEGGSGTNGNGDDYEVEALGIEVASNIAYRNLTTYLTTTSVYTDAREGSIRSAIDLYGECSNEVQQVIKAWQAVGIGGESYTMDIVMQKVLSPVNNCSLSEEETVEVELRLAKMGCTDFIAAGTSIQMTLEFENEDPVVETWILDVDWNEDEIISYAFDQTISLPEMAEEYEFTVTLEYEGDSVVSNNFIEDFEVERKFDHSGFVMDFESVAHSADSFYINTERFSLAKVSSAAENTGNRGFQLTARNTTGYLTPFADDPSLNFVQQPELYSSICFCVDAQEWDAVSLYFDMKQTYSMFYLQSWGGDSAEYASSMRMLINGEQFGEQFHPTTFEDDPYLSYAYNLNEYAGQYFEFCFQSKNYVNPANDQIPESPGDNTFLDNVQFTNEELLSINELDMQTFSIYPNPSQGEVFLELESNFTGSIEVWNSLGKKVYQENVNYNSGLNQIDLHKLESGIYMIKLLNGKGEYNETIILH